MYLPSINRATTNPTRLAIHRSSLLVRDIMAQNAVPIALAAAMASAAAYGEQTTLLRLALHCSSGDACLRHVLRSRLPEARRACACS